MSPTSSDLVSNHASNVFVGAPEAGPGGTSKSYGQVRKKGRSRIRMCVRESLHTSKALSTKLQVPLHVRRYYCNPSSSLLNSPSVIWSFCISRSDPILPQEFGLLLHAYISCPIPQIFDPDTGFPFLNLRNMVSCLALLPCVPTPHMLSFRQAFVSQRWHDRCEVKHQRSVHRINLHKTPNGSINGSRVDSSHLSIIHNSVIISASDAEGRHTPPYRPNVTGVRVLLESVPLHFWRRSISVTAEVLAAPIAVIILPDRLTKITEDETKTAATRYAAEEDVIWLDVTYHKSRCQSYPIRERTGNIPYDGPHQSNLPAPPSSYKHRELHTA